MTADLSFDEMNLYYANVPVGDILRHKRESYNQSLPDVEAALHIRASMLGSIEQGRYDDLPGRTYCIGFIRTYAEYLDLDAERMVKLFKSQANAAPKPSLSELAPKAGDNNVPKLSLIAASLVIFIVVLSVLGGRSGQDEISVQSAPLLSHVQNDIFSSEGDSILVDNALNPLSEKLYY